MKTFHVSLIRRQSLNLTIEADSAEDAERKIMRMVEEGELSNSPYPDRWQDVPLGDDEEFIEYLEQMS